MGKRGRMWQPKPSTTQSGVLNYASLTAKRRRFKKTSKRRAFARELERTYDVLRQINDKLDGVDWTRVKAILDANPQMSLAQAKALSKEKQ